MIEDNIFVYENKQWTEKLLESAKSEGKTPQTLANIVNKIMEYRKTI